MGNVFCFNGFNHFTWFNMGRIMKSDRCLIKTIKTESITQVSVVTQNAFGGLIMCHFLQIFCSLCLPEITRIC